MQFSKFDSQITSECERDLSEMAINITPFIPL